MSTFTKGEQMVPVLNKLGVHCAVYGNHDFGRWTFLFVFVFIVICIWLPWLFVLVFVICICICICSISCVWHWTTVGSIALNVTTICFAAELLRSEFIVYIFKYEIFFVYILIFLFRLWPGHTWESCGEDRIPLADVKCYRYTDAE